MYAAFYSLFFLLLNVSDRNFNKSQPKSSVTHFSRSSLSEIKIPLFRKLQRISSSKSAKVIVVNCEWAEPERLIGVATLTKGGQGLVFSYQCTPQEFWTIPNCGKASRNIRLRLSVAIGGHQWGNPVHRWPPSFAGGMQAQEILFAWCLWNYYSKCTCRKCTQGK